MNNLPQPDEGFDMELDLLVDDELPETERARLLRTLDDAPQQWRNVAIRFLQRQVERGAIRQFVQQRPGDRSELNPAVPVTLRHHFRLAAAFLLTAGLAGGFAFLLAHNQNPNNAALDTTTPQTASTVSFSVPIEPLTDQAGLQNQMNLPVSVLRPGAPPDIRMLVHDVPPEGAAARHVVIVPNGQDGAVVFPVTTIKSEVVY